jgi:hypothetical protein
VSKQGAPEEPQRARLTLSVPLTALGAMVLFGAGIVARSPAEKVLGAVQTEAHASAPTDEETRLRVLEKDKAVLEEKVGQICEDLKQVKADVRELLTTSRRR